MLAILPGRRTIGKGLQRWRRMHVILQVSGKDGQYRRGMHERLRMRVNAFFPIFPVIPACQTECGR